MSEYEVLRKDIEDVAASMAGYASAVNRNADAVGSELTRLWDENATLRDELHGVANRLQNLTAFVTSEVAASIVNEANRATLRSVRGDDAS